MFKLQVVQRARCVGADNKGGLCAGSCNEPPALAELFAFGSHLGFCTQPNVTLACFRARFFLWNLQNHQQSINVFPPLWWALCFLHLPLMIWCRRKSPKNLYYSCNAWKMRQYICEKWVSLALCQFWVLEISCLVVLRLKPFWQMFTQKVAFGLYLIPSPVQVDKNIERIRLLLCVYCVGFRAA